MQMHEAGAALDFADKVMRSAPTPAGRFVVNHDNILAAAKIIQAQVDELEELLAECITDLTVASPGNDTVSRQMSKEWNDRLVRRNDSYRSRVTDYVRSLKSLVTQLRDSAIAYGFNEQEIAAAFRTQGA